MKQGGQDRTTERDIGEVSASPVSHQSWRSPILEMQSKFGGLSLTKPLKLTDTSIQLY